MVISLINSSYSYNDSKLEKFKIINLIKQDKRILISYDGGINWKEVISLKKHPCHITLFTYNQILNSNDCAKSWLMTNDNQNYWNINNIELIQICSTDKLIFKLDDYVNYEYAIIYLINMQMQVIKKENVYQWNSSRPFIIDFYNLANGIYFILILTQNKVYNFKFTVFK